MTEIPKLLETVPLPYVQPLTKPMVQAIKSLGEAKMVELAVQEEHKKGTTQVSITRSTRPSQEYPDLEEVNMRP